MTNNNKQWNVLVLYDSLYGNTERIAVAVASACKPGNKVKLVSSLVVSHDDLQSVDLFIVGSPTQGGRAKVELQTFLSTIPSNSLKNVCVAAFDTRFAEKDHGLALKLLMKTIGFAAPKIATLLKQKGGRLLVPPEGFIVTGKEGPLKNGEIERAIKWGEDLLAFK